MNINFKKKLTIFLIVFFSVLSILYFLFDKEETETDILIFSPHPDDEVLCCGGTILKAVEEGKKVRIVFFTNGDGEEELVSIDAGKNLKDLEPEDFINFGKKRQEEAENAAKKLGIKEEDLIFLSYPDGELVFLLDNFYDDFRFSQKTNSTSSPYGITFGLARQGYTKNNLVSDIKKVLETYSPGAIYVPHALDNHADHQAANNFIFLALNELNSSENNSFDSLDIFYYLIHDPFAEGAVLSYLYSSNIFPKEEDKKEDISDFKEQKKLALEEYASQMVVAKRTEFLHSFINDFEVFWAVASTPKVYLESLEQEWKKIGEYMKSLDYNVNFAPVVDIAKDIENFDLSLSGQKRMYSEDPMVVTDLAEAVIKGLNSSGITPVIKHFPGLGNIDSDTHAWLAETEISKEGLYQRELVPFVELIGSNHNFWVMVGHAVYLALDDKPASLSYEIQTKLLREELGFKGIIVADELLAMQSMKEYAFQQNMKDPYIGEIISRSFAAGTDIAIFYVPSLSEAEQIADETFAIVEEKISKNEISQQQIDESVARILAEKERIFGVPLKHLLGDMTLKEKVLQKLLTDVYSGNDENTVANIKKILLKYNFGGIHSRGLDFVKEIQGKVKIPMFVSGQHEGGLVNQYGLNVYTQSAYMVGKEFEFLKKINGQTVFYNAEGEKTDSNEGEFIVPEPLAEADRQEIINTLIGSIDELISLFSKIEQGNPVSPNPNYLSPLTIYFSSHHYEVKNFFDVPIVWLRKFPDQEAAFQAYILFKEAFEDWKKDQRKLSSYLPDIIPNLKSLRQKIEGKKRIIDDPEDLEKVRILFLATHPDDEDSEALAYFKNKYNTETYILLATRGEGGENKKEQEPNGDLGKLRTEEMEKAGEILNVNEIYYMDLEDFGYCVSETEAMEKWGKEGTLKQITYFYNLIKPHIIISKNTASDEHCQHKAFILLAQEAFERFSDGSWKPLKFYQRDSKNENGIFIDISEKDDRAGRTYKEIALESLSQYESQQLGEWAKTKSSLWPDKFFYSLVGTKVDYEGDSVFSGINKEDL